MSYTPRTADEITESLLAKTVSPRSPLTDRSKGSALYIQTRPVGEEIGYVEYRLWTLRNSYNISNPNISLVDFKERLKELPNGGLEMLGATPASGTHMSFIRQSSVAEQTMPSGSTVGRSDGSSLVYRTLVDVVFPIGSLQVSNVYVACLSPGEVGNCAAGVVTKGANVPDWIASVVNTAPFTNGQDEETREQALRRALLYLEGLSGCQRARIEFLGLSFTSSDGTRAKFAKGYVDYLRPGYSELIVDDGSGFASLVQPGGVGLLGTVPSTGQTMILHAAPATKPISEVQVTRMGGGVEVLTEAAGQIASVHEQGFVYVPSGQAWSLQPGDTWAIPATNIYGGFIEELQREIVGNINADTPGWYPSSGGVGWLAMGCRIVVKPPTALPIDLALHVVPSPGYALDAAQDVAANLAAGYVNSLGPGEPLYMAKLTAAIMASSVIQNVHIYDSIVPLTLKQDTYPTERQVTRTDVTNISFLAL